MLPILESAFFSVLAIVVFNLVLRAQIIKCAINFADIDVNAYSCLGFPRYSVARYNYDTFVMRCKRSVRRKVCAFVYVFLRMHV